MSVLSGHEAAEAHIRERAHAETMACMAGHRAWWWCYQYRCNFSAFNGYHQTPSDYSGVKCEHCGRRWRTKAAYVEGLPTGWEQVPVLPDGGRGGEEPG